jgi:putative membrane protein
MSAEREKWGKTIFNIKDSVIPGIFGKVIIAVLFAIIIAIADAKGLPVAQESFSSIIPELVLGLLLVFRTDTAYNRFWDGSGIISDIIDLSRGLARSIWVYIDTDDDIEQQNKIYHTRMVGLFLATVKQHLRHESVDPSIEALLTPEQAEELRAVNHMPIRITQWLSVYLKNAYEEKKLSTIMFNDLNNMLNNLTLSMGSCEKILTTPLPRPYAIHLKHLLVLYFFLVPFKLVGSLHAGTPIAVAIIAFALLGIEEIGLEIENPFGYDDNDLPLDAQSQELRDDIEEIIAGSPLIKEALTPLDSKN